MKLFKNPLFVIFIIVIILATGGWLIFGHSKKSAYNFVIAKRGDLVQEVSATGKVKPVQSVDLAFEKSGKVKRVYVDVGDRAGAGILLVELDGSELAAQLLSAEAAFKVAKSQLAELVAYRDAQAAKLEELKKGTRPENIKITESALKKSQQDLANYYDNVFNVLNDAYAKSDDAVRRQTDDIFNNDESDNPQLAFPLYNLQTEIDVERKRLLVKNILNEWRAELDSLKATSSAEAIDQSIVNAKKHISDIRDFLNRAFDALNESIGIAPTMLDAYKSNINIGRTNVNAAAASVSNQEQLIVSQKLIAEKAQNELNLQTAGNLPEQISAQESLLQQAEANIISQDARINQAEANVLAYKIQLDKMIIKSPFSGIVTRQDAKIGQIISANNPVISVISESKFEIEANIPEADIVKLKIGNFASVTLDAYASDIIFEAVVVKIDPAETLIGGVSTYKTTLQFKKDDERVKPGMTANIDILTDKRESVIIVPQGTVFVKDNSKLVNIEVNSGIIEKREVKTGLRGSDGNIEIIEGVKEGDKIITSIIEISQ